MTIERKCVIALGDIKTVCFECASCGARLTLNLETIVYAGNRSGIPFTCPHCNSEWREKSAAQIEKGTMRTIPEDFVIALHGLTAQGMRSYGFRILLKIDQPDQAFDL